MRLQRKQIHVDPGETARLIKYLDGRSFSYWVRKKVSEELARYEAISSGRTQFDPHFGGDAA